MKKIYWSAEGRLVISNDYLSPISKIAPLAKNHFHAHLNVHLNEFLNAYFNENWNTQLNAHYMQIVTQYVKFQNISKPL